MIFFGNNKKDINSIFTLPETNQKIPMPAVKPPKIDILIEKIVTNYEFITNATIEQMTVIIQDLNCKNCTYNCSSNGFERFEECKNEIRKWLKEES